MPFVKLDCGLLDSTLWIDREAREVFITALLMAEPIETIEPIEQIAVDDLCGTGWYVPPGWYGMVHAAGPGIVHRAGIDMAAGMAALKRLGDTDPGSRSPAHDGRRLVRIAGGYIVLNFFVYRDRDYTTAERSRRYRERIKSRRDGVTLGNSVTKKRHVTRDITQAEAEAEAEAEAKTKKNTTVADATQVSKKFEEFKKTYPKRTGAQPWGLALRAIKARLQEGIAWAEVIAGAGRYARFCEQTGKIGTEYVMQAKTFCGPEKHFLAGWLPPLSKAEKQQDASVNASLQWLQQQEAADAKH